MIYDTIFHPFSTTSRNVSCNIILPSAIEILEYQSIFQSSSVVLREVVVAYDMSDASRKRKISNYMIGSSKKYNRSKNVSSDKMNSKNFSKFSRKIQQNCGKNKRENVTTNLVGATKRSTVPKYYFTETF